MIITPIRTDKIRANDTTLFELLDKHLEKMAENSVLAITSKIVSLCEGRVAPVRGTDKEALIKQESSYFLPAEISKYGHHFTIAYNSLIAVAGIDESNGDKNYILWPHNPQETANSVRKYLMDRFGLTTVGVIITDSTCTPLRLGTTGMILSHSGFKALRNYVGKPDLFGKPLTVTQANIAGGLAAAAVLVMGEGDEQTPLAIMSDLSFIEFQNDVPTKQELDELIMSREDDLFAPFLNAVDWQKGDK